MDTRNDQVLAHVMCWGSYDMSMFLRSTTCYEFGRGSRLILWCDNQHLVFNPNNTRTLILDMRGVRTRFTYFTIISSGYISQDSV